MPIYAWIIIIIFVLIASFIAGFFVTRIMIQKQISKNPLIDEDTIRAMMEQMGKKPSEAQIQRILKNISKKK